MRIIISPAKKMRDNPELWDFRGLPVFLDQSRIILEWIRSLSYAEQKKLWACNDGIAQENARRYACMDLEQHLTPALFAYDGIQYTSMGAEVFEDHQLDYLQQHLRILSGFYGVLRPMDGVVPYRLEMQAKARIAGKRDLYDFWGDRLYREVMDADGILVNLASVEYARSIEPYLSPSDRYITCVFGELENGKVVQKGVYAKMARGDMVRFLAETGAETPESLTAFSKSGYHFDENRSSETEYVFIREEVPGKRKSALR